MDFKSPKNDPKCFSPMVKEKIGVVMGKIEVVKMW
jgi:hypothetical protein